MQHLTPARPNGHLLALGSLILMAGLTACTGTTPAVSASPRPSPSGAAASAKPPLTAAALDTDACEHFDKGPAAPVVATATAAAGPLVSKAHTRFDITLSAGNQASYVRYASSKAGDMVFYLNKPVPLAVTDDAGKVVTPSRSATSVGPCGTIQARHQVNLGVGTYTLKLGPTAETAAQFVAISTDDTGEEK
ncbi:MAG: hypothetical protein H7338_19210 [Candidatus Sericytochromatia bacterium]|nr:hypothetical protein [Candidatus Sericytochromatia bacterium]